MKNNFVLHVLISCIVLLTLTSIFHSTTVKIASAVTPSDITPTLFCLGGVPCPGQQASVTVPSTGPVTSTVPGNSSIATSPVASVTPCQTSQASVKNVKHHHKSRRGGSSGFLSQFMQFLLQLLEQLFKLIGIQLPNLPIPAPGQSGTPSTSPSESPSTSSAPAPSQAPCPPLATSSAPSQPQTSSAPSTSTAPATSTAPSTGATAPSGTPPAGGQTLGVCGIKPPAAGPNVILTTTDSTAPLNITSGGTAASPKIYDGGCHTVGTITIKADYVTVQNFKIVASGQYGFDSEGTGITMQNNDISNIHVSGDGDLNAITFFGNNTKIMYNTANNFVTGNPGESHTDAIQTWVSSSHPTASTNVTIQGNRFTGPANPTRDNNIASIHQCVMAEGLNDGGNTGGDGNPSNWLIADNYFGDSWGQCIKLDGVDNVSITRNNFAGSSDSVAEIDATSSNVKFYDDNIISGSYSSKPATVPGPGPTSL